MKNNVKSSFLKAKMFMCFKMSDRKKVPIIASYICAFDHL